MTDETLESRDENDKFSLTFGRSIRKNFQFLRKGAKGQPIPQRLKIPQHNMNDDEVAINRSNIGRRDFSMNGRYTDPERSSG